VPPDYSSSREESKTCLELSPHPLKFWISRAESAPEAPEGWWEGLLPFLGAGLLLLKAQRLSEALGGTRVAENVFLELPTSYLSVGLDKGSQVLCH
jgi:hypothetical protein